MPEETLTPIKDRKLEPKVPPKIAPSPLFGAFKSRILNISSK